MRRYPGIAMPRPNLEDKAIRIVGEFEAYWDAIGRRLGGSSWDNHYPAARNEYSGQLTDRRIEGRLIEVIGILLIHMAAISNANFPPARWKESDTAKRINRIVVKCIRSATGDVHRRTRFTN